MNDSLLMKSTRKDLGLSQKKMAQKMGYSNQSTVSLIETGERGLSSIARTFLNYIRENERHIRFTR